MTGVDMRLIARNTLHKQAIERLAEAVTDNRIVLKIHPTTSALSCPHLLATQTLHEIVRNMENVDSMPVIKRILSGANEGPMWRYTLDQSGRRAQYKAGIERIDRQLKSNQIKSKFESVDYEEKLKQARLQYSLIVEFMRDEVKGTLHPNGSSTGMFDGWRIKGMSIRLAGPKKATKAGAWTRSVGAPGINSYQVVVGDEANLQLPTRTGTYGLTVRIAWSAYKDLVMHKGMVYTDGIKPFELVNRYNQFNEF